MFGFVWAKKYDDDTAIHKSMIFRIYNPEYDPIYSQNLNSWPVDRVS